MSEKESSKLFLELGQVIKIIAPSNSAINDKNYYIEYLDNNKVKLLNDLNLDDEIEIGITNGGLNDESITQINILATPEVKGYARQKDLIPEKMGNLVKKFKEAGATILGGCCETTPQHIREMSRHK